MKPITSTDLPLRRISRGKVRDVFEVDAGRLLLVASDRVSAFDVVMQDAVPFKGAVLTQMSAWWFRQIGGIAAHHMLAADIDEILAAVPALARHRGEIAGRAMLCRRTSVFPIECVVRGYISGSAWKEYAATGTLAGEPLPAGLVESGALTPPLFSPATKAETGHDENITIARMRQLLGAEASCQLEAASRAVFDFGSRIAAERGIIIADTKFEFGRAADGQLLLIDEVMTPDSSRFWPAELYKPGRPQPSFDKQPLRDWLDAERRAGRWDGETSVALPGHVVEAMSARYLDAYRRLTGSPLDPTALQ